MCRFIILLFLYLPAYLIGQEINLSSVGFSYPAIQKTAPKWQGFIPKGWEILDTAIGDLNKDGWKDVAMEIQISKPFFIYKTHDASFIDTIKIQPRMFVLCFYDKTKKIFNRYLTDTLLIPRNDSIMDDMAIQFGEPLDKISIQKGILIINLWFGYEFNRNSTSYTYKFRYQTASMALIGTEYRNYDSGHDEINCDFNFSTGKYTYRSGNGLSGIYQKPIYGKITVKNIPSLNNWHKFKVLKDIYL